MRSFKLSNVFAILLAIVVAAAGVELIGQGKGKGRGGDRGGQKQKAERGGGEKGRGNGRSEAQAQRVRQANPGGERRAQGRDERADRGRGRGSDRQVRAQPQQVIRQRQPEQRRVREVRAERDRGRGGNRDRIRAMQNARQPRVIPQQKSITWFPQGAQSQRARRDDRSDRRDDRSERRGDRSSRRDRQHRNVHVQRQAVPWAGVWPRNYGQQRRAEVHQRNADRRNQRDDRRSRTVAYVTPLQFWQQTYVPRFIDRGYNDPDRQGYSRPSVNYPYPYEQYGYNQNVPQYTYGQRYSPVVYSQGYYNYNEPRLSGADFLRNLIFAVLGGNSQNYGAGYSPQYSAGYAPDAYFGSSYSPQYAGYNASPYYSGGSTYDPYYDNGYSNYDDGYYAEALPVQYFANSGPGTGLFRDMFSQLLAIGYDQGYNDGVAARRIRERDRTFYDPYAYDNEVYDPYSVSLGDNRRSLSRGYELGYQDAIESIRGYDQFQTGDVDLVSVLIGTVSQLM